MPTKPRLRLQGIAYEGYDAGIFGNDAAAAAAAGVYGESIAAISGSERRRRLIQQAPQPSINR